jgi:hypothetical protein
VRRVAIVLPLLATALVDCRPSNVPPATPSGDCDEAIGATAHEGRIVSIAEVLPDSTVAWSDHLGTVPVAASRFYAVVGVCRHFEEWNARWLEEPSRRWGSWGRGGTLAFGPVNARHVFARRIVPVRATLSDDNGMPAPTPPHVGAVGWTRLVAIAIDPSTMIEVRGRRCANDTASVRELRVIEDGTSTVVHRVTTRDDVQEL